MVPLAALGLRIFFSFSQASFWLYSDPANFIVDANKLRKGYFASNLAALRGADSQPVQLKTEGGFPFLLWLVRCLHPDFPFILNALLAPIFFAAMAWLLHLTGRTRAPPLVFLLFLIVFFMLPSLRYQLYRYCLPYRDLSAHTLAIAGLCCMLCAQRSERKRGWLATAGLLLGVGMWFRLPVFLFLPATFYLFVQVAIRESSHRKRFGMAGALVLGGMLGLLPLVAQNIFECKAFYQAGQMDIMISDKSLSLDAPAADTISLANASYNAWPLLRMLIEIFPPWTWLLVLVGAVCVPGRPYRRTSVWLFLILAITFYLFYACYIKSVPRYIWMANFFLLPMAVIWIAERIDPYRKVCFPLLSVIAAALMVYWGITEGRFRANLEARADTKAFAKWLHAEVDGGSVVFTPSHALQAWTANYGDPQTKVYPRWPLHSRADAEQRFPIPFTDEERATCEVLMMTFGDADGQRMPSVWRNDMLNEYTLVPRKTRCPIKRMPVSWLELESIAPRDMTGVERISLRRPEQEQPAYFVARCFDMRPLGVTFREDGHTLGAAEFNSGPNIVALPRGTGGNLNMEFLGPQTVMETFAVQATSLLQKDFQGYGQLPSISNYVRNVSLKIHYFADWSRDWGHDPRYRTVAFVLVSDGSVFRFPPQPRSCDLRVYLSVRAPGTGVSLTALIDDLQQCEYRYGDHSLPPTTWFIGPSYQEGGYTNIDIIHELRIDQQPSHDPTLVLRAPHLGPAYRLLLLRTEYEAIDENYQPVHPPGATVFLPRSGQKWAHGIPPYFPAFSRLQRIEPVTNFSSQ
jgi:hypothetical protein